MNAKDLLRSLKNTVDVQSAFQPEEIIMKISDNEALVFIPIEGKVKLMKVVVEDCGVWTGISEVPRQLEKKVKRQLRCLR